MIEKYREKSTGLIYNVMKAYDDSLFLCSDIGQIFGVESAIAISKEELDKKFEPVGFVSADKKKNIYRKKGTNDFFELRQTDGEKLCFWLIGGNYCIALEKKFLDKYFEPVINIPVEKTLENEDLRIEVIRNGKLEIFYNGHFGVLGCKPLNTYSLQELLFAASSRLKSNCGSSNKELIEKHIDMALALLTKE